MGVPMLFQKNTDSLRVEPYVHEERSARSAVSGLFRSPSLL